MDQTIKQKWVEALRSGKYKQGKKQLKTADGRYCCLGVLCSVTKQKGWTNLAELPTHISVKVGVDRVGHLPSGDCLTELNDDGGLTFEQIADIIEEQL